MLQELTEKYQRKMWKSMISRKKLPINIWDVLEYKNEKVYYMPYSAIHKFQVTTRYCQKCNKELEIGFRKNEFIVCTCACSSDGKNFPTVDKLSTLFTADDAKEVMLTFNNSKTRNLANRAQYWVNQGYSIKDSKKKVSDVQTRRSIRSPASKPGSIYSVRKTEYWMQQGFSDLEAKEKVREYQVRNGLEYYIGRYGEESGRKKYTDRMASWHQSMSALSFGISKISTELFEAVDPEKRGCYGTRETTVRGQEKVHRVDYVDKSQKKIIEFDGDYWHANPEMFQPDDRVRNKNASEIWEYDKKKTQDLEAAGYKVLRIPENQFREYPEETISQCKRFLNEN